MAVSTTPAQHMEQQIYFAFYLCYIFFVFRHELFIKIYTTSSYVNRARFTYEARYITQPQYGQTQKPIRVSVRRLKICRVCANNMREWKLFNGKHQAIHWIKECFATVSNVIVALFRLLWLALWLTPSAWFSHTRVNFGKNGCLQKMSSYYRYQ